MAWSKELQDSWKKQHDVKNQQQECAVCGSPITKEEYIDYKMCPWCYSQHVFNPDEPQFQESQMMEHVYFMSCIVAAWTAVVTSGIWWLYHLHNCAGQE